ncbi:hypothetical protein KFK09_016568 [Dendrobium nobile]|uniref:Uncharacterized protein n=1 Tax=Dendrobium nobile TaxID=94219 RepID=A0A8T3AYL2_DENNO|nr:hypothetical protein KFK09_016568 [Dendrobium nobile]
MRWRSVGRQRAATAMPARQRRDASNCDASECEATRATRVGHAGIPVRRGQLRPFSLPLRSIRFACGGIATVVFTLSPGVLP